MAQLGGLIASALLKVVGDQIGSVLGGQIKLRYNFNKDLQRMKETLESVEAVLLEAEKRAITDNTVRLWLKRLKDAMYAISDMLDDFEATREVSRKKKLAVAMPFLTNVSKIKMANKMKTMRDHVAEITAQHKAFNLMAGTGASEQKVTDARVTTSWIPKAQIIERTDEEQKILASLSKGITEQTTFLPIYGIGGLGKTTMAKMIYNNSQFQDYSRVWVYVSQTFDLSKIGNSIISQLSGNKCQDTDRETIHISLQKLFAEKRKILVVLDDLWEGSNFLLDDLKTMLTVEKGSKVVVIVTTRNEDIAKKMSIWPHKLAPLTNDMCWTIIKQKSGFEDKDDKSHLEQIGIAIAMKCGGVGLAAQSLGYMLKYMQTSREWESVRDNDIWTLSTSYSEDTPARQVIASLRLSYSSMPPYLKLCFAYCAIFPKGHKIVKDDLIHQWISLDFIKPTRISSSHLLGEKYIMDLLGLSFLEQSKSSLTDRVHPDDVTLFTMHDLVHDLARSVMDDEILVSCKDINFGGSSCHYALLDDCSNPLESPRIRALCFMDSTEIGLHDDALASVKSMRVLDLSQCLIHKLPDFIGQSKLLKYLNAPRIQDVTVPNSITSLSKLNYLCLRDSSTLLTLPQSIGEIEDLMYLDLSGCSGLRELPKSFGKLKRLVHLDLSNCSRVCNVSEFLGSLTELQYLNLSKCECIGKLPASLGVLSDLQYLNLSFSSYTECSNVKVLDTECSDVKGLDAVTISFYSYSYTECCSNVEVLGALTKLEYLNLSSHHSCINQLPEVLGSFDKLKYLCLSGCQQLTELPWKSGNHKSVVYLDLSGCRGLNYVQVAFDGLTNLQYLNLSGCLFYYPHGSPEGTIDRLMVHISTLSSLEHLDLSNNGYSIESLPESIGNLRKLHTLDISYNYAIKKLPESIRTIDSLKMLYLKGCNYLSQLPQLGTSSISLPLFGVHAGDGESSSNLVLLKDTNPVELKITHLENVKSAEEVVSIKLMEKEELQELTLNWTLGAHRFVDDEVLLEKLEPPSSLYVLAIQGYNGVSLPAWLNQLPNLTKLKLEFCDNLRLKSPLPGAEQLEIVGTDNVLSSWEECTLSHTGSSSSVTTELTVRSSKLPLYRWRLLDQLPDLTELSIKMCESTPLNLSSPEIIRRLSFLQVLCLTGNDDEEEELPKWLGELTSLQKLKINGYAGLKELDENIRKLTKLQMLELNGCNSLSSLPHWLKELTCLDSLDIIHCKGIRSLPEGIEQLTNLQKLRIWGCSQLSRWCESEENKMKLAHIKRRMFYC